MCIFHAVFVEIRFSVKRNCGHSKYYWQVFLYKKDISPVYVYKFALILYLDGLWYPSSHRVLDMFPTTLGDDVMIQIVNCDVTSI